MTRTYNPSRQARILLAACLLTIAFPTAATAQRAPMKVYPSAQQVSFADLNLNDERDAETLMFRLNSAAKSVCGTLDRASLKLKAMHRTCYRSAIDNAVTAVGHPTLSDTHQRAHQWATQMDTSIIFADASETTITLSPAA